MYWVGSQKGIISSFSHAINFDSWLVWWEWWPLDIVITLTLKMGRAWTWEQHAIGIMLDWAVHTSHSMCKGAAILVTGHISHIKANSAVFLSVMMQNVTPFCHLMLESCSVSKKTTRRSSLPPSITFNYRCLINRLLISNFSKNICDAVIVMSTLLFSVFSITECQRLLFIL